MTTKSSIFCLVIFIFSGCGSPREKIPNEPLMTYRSQKVVVYQVMTRLFGNKKTVNRPFGTLEENGCGKFADITKPALAGIKQLGVTHLWLTGVLEHATL